MSRMRVSARTDERQPLYLQIQEHFKQLIQLCAMEENDKLPTEKQLMEQFGVSRMTVSNALTQLAKDGWIYRIPGRGSFVSPESRTKVEDESLDYNQLDAIDVKEQDERASSRKMIGFVLPLLEDFFAIRLLKGINSVLENKNYYVSIVLTHNSKEREKEAIQELIKNGAIGLIIFPIDAETYNEEILVLKLRKFPFVLIDRYLPGFDTHCVCSDNWMSAQLAVNHLWEQGHRDIAICSDISIHTVTVDERIRGYMEALKQKGSMINPALIVTDFQVTDTIPIEKHPLYHYLKYRTATAFITLNLKLGLILTSLVKKLGMNIPRDLSIITYDNPSSELDGNPTFTHIDQHEQEIGAKSAELLLKLLNNQESVKEPTKVIVKSALVLGESTGELLVKK
ncbi:GntR family transcriptional regulator of arabinose operon [Paenibacillus sp. V4I3]|uniref:GntR family transcriptional regulator n=1 Tax=unclassified Paenibacillus TaxID=185978 RepID=UPI002784B925|nr:MULTISPECIES: GntR family transcriptional regulator [unclassified Paenibacillus]MDQ0876247.1 GntR family transcriptional regulator of arabinose operon [Paenibacillus sp. V4I3]MDQ0887720.1 GntR family transcriptional regulator of arabinose operon [Paenibacillus sp. V4I9]